MIPPEDAKRQTENLGPVVACDYCNYGEETLGGVLLGSYAVCGDCTKSSKILEEDFEDKEHIVEIWDKKKTFKENVLEYRKRTTGTEDAIKTIISW